MHNKIKLFTSKSRIPAFLIFMGVGIERGNTSGRRWASGPFAAGTNPMHGRDTKR